MVAAALPQVIAQPFLKWAGGKSQLLRQFGRFYPVNVERYMEPFVGSAAVFFDVRRQFNLVSALLSDNNDDLINCYRVVRDCVDDLISLLEQHQQLHHASYPAHYYQVRAQAPRNPVRRAARLIYLNKTCYNGLYRVNGRGQFNVPIGRYQKPPICDAALLSAGSRALRGVELVVEDFADSARRAKAGTFVYIDPPYVPMSKTANFTSYTPNGFGPVDQERLAQVVRYLDSKGCYVMVSNSATRAVRELYKGFTFKRVTARRAINSNGSKRGRIGEVVMLNYDPSTTVR